MSVRLQAGLGGGFVHGGSDHGCACLGGREGSAKAKQATLPCVSREVHEDKWVTAVNFTCAFFWAWEGPLEATWMARSGTVKLRCSWRIWGSSHYLFLARSDQITASSTVLCSLFPGMQQAHPAGPPPHAGL